MRRDYARRDWVRSRCAQAREKVLACLRSIDEQAPLPDQAIGCLFAAAITTHVLLAAGLQNPTVRARYTAVKDLLAGYGVPQFHEALLRLLGSAEIGKERAHRHVATLAEIFDVAAGAIRSPFSFASDIGGAARPIAIDGSLETIGRGRHREAMFCVAIRQRRAEIERALPQVWETAETILAANPAIEHR